MESIIDILHKGGYSCVMKNREEVRTFTTGSSGFV